MFLVPPALEIQSDCKIKCSGRFCASFYTRNRGPYFCRTKAFSEKNRNQALHHTREGIVVPGIVDSQAIFKIPLDFDMRKYINIYICDICDICCDYFVQTRKNRRRRASISVAGQGEHTQTARRYTFAWTEVIQGRGMFLGGVGRFFSRLATQARHDQFNSATA